MNNNRLEITHIAGTPRACGQAYGERFEPLIMGFLRSQMAPDKKRLAFARRCWPYVENSAPNAAALLRGMAEASHLSLEHLLLLTLHEEFVHLPHCTAFAATGGATRGGKTIVAQNWDWSTSLYPWPGLLRLSIKGKPAAALYHYPGLWACAGVNDAGLALMWTGSGYFPKVPPVVGVPTYVLIAEILLRKSTDQAVAYLKGVRHAGSFIFFLADAGGNTAVVEAVPGKIAVQQSCSAITRANHYMCPEVVRCSKQQLKRGHGSLKKHGRMNDLVEASKGRINIAITKRILTDRVTTWPGLNQFPGGKEAVTLNGMTIDSLFAVCNDRVLWTCRGGREPGPWQNISL